MPDPCADKPVTNHLMWEGRLYDVTDVTVIDIEDGATLLEVWAVKRGEGGGKSQ
jgi:hypothetical protein